MPSRWYALPPMASLKTKIEGNLQRVRENIAAACARCGREPQQVTLVAITKSATLEGIKHLMDLGVTDLGEGRVQQMVERAAEIDGYLQRRRTPGPAPVRWHMVGHLQRNKVKPAMEVAGIIHSIDSLRLAEEINARAEQQERVIDVLIQVNCSNESQKFGVAVGAALHLGELLSTLRNLRAVGLMTMAPAVKDPEDARPAFARLRELFDEMRHEKIGGDAFRHLSMGMSQDYPIAIEEGATLLRIGSALFD